MKQRRGTQSFRDLGVRRTLLKRLKELDIVAPTPIQDKVIPFLLHQDSDLVGQAPTGTGKTLAYGIPLLHKVQADRDKIQALVLCPTRELGQQIAKAIFKLTKYEDTVYTECIYGGAAIEPQIKSLQRTTHILVATPGRLLEMIQKGVVNLDAVQTVVLDEADEMLSLGFKKELDKILDALPGVRSRWLFSATMPHSVGVIVRQHLSPDVEHILMSSKSGVNKKVDHQFLICAPEEKSSILLQFLGGQHGTQGMVFCKTKAAVKSLTEWLQSKRVKVDAIHGDLLQKERNKAMRAFKKGHTNVLIATDLTARGIDVPDLGYVVHYEMPSSDEYYTHRSGRTGRGGRSGTSISLVTGKEMKQLRILEKKLGVSFKQIRRMK